jgi:hypothetical protein
MSEKKGHRPFGKNTFFIRTAGGGTFQGTCDTATRPATCPLDAADDLMLDRRLHYRRRL